MNTPNEVTVEQALDALSRFIHSHFRETGKECARFSIPSNMERDDDMILLRFIDQYEALRAAPPKIDGVPRCKECGSKNVMVTCSDCCGTGCRKPNPLTPPKETT